MKKLLIIENDADTIDVVSIILEDFKYTVVQSQKQLSIEEVAEIDPNVIVIDYLLLDGLGSDLCFKIKQHPSTKDMPVILTSASLHLEKVIIDCKAGAFIAKPFDLIDFVELVNKVAI